MKGCICPFRKWQIHTLISKATILCLIFYQLYAGKVDVSVVPDILSHIHIIIEGDKLAFYYFTITLATYQLLFFMYIWLAASSVLSPPDSVGPSMWYSIPSNVNNN